MSLTREDIIKRALELVNKMENRFFSENSVNPNNENPIQLIDVKAIGYIKEILVESRTMDQVIPKKSIG